MKCDRSLEGTIWRNSPKIYHRSGSTLIPESSNTKHPTPGIRWLFWGWDRNDWYRRWSAPTQQHVIVESWQNWYFSISAYGIDYVYRLYVYLVCDASPYRIPVTTNKHIHDHPWSLLHWPSQGVSIWMHTKLQIPETQMLFGSVPLFPHKNTYHYQKETLFKRKTSINYRVNPPIQNHLFLFGVEEAVGGRL